MCSPTHCRTCSKTTWSGCGAHVAEVRAGIPHDQWCDGHAHQRAQATDRPNGAFGLSRRGR